MPVASTGTRRLLQTLAALLLIAVTLPVAGATRVGDEVTYRCRQPETRALRCEYRFIEPRQASRLSARVDGTELPVERGRSFPAPGETVAVLILVDTSDPARAPVIARNIEQIGDLVDAAPSHYALGLARFDSALQMLTPIGAGADTIKQAAAGLAAVGRTTELYRSTIDAIRRIQAFEADRRVLFIFSDGLAEDYAYDHQDVIDAALEAGVAIYSFGFPRSVSLSVALQSLRRLSEESGGRFVAAGDDLRLPQSAREDPFRGIDSGGNFSVDLAPAVEAGLGGTQRVTVTLHTGAGALDLSVPVELPTPEPVVRIPETTPAAQPAAPPPPAPPGRQPADGAPYGPVSTWLWFGTPAAFQVIVIAALVVYGRIQRRREPPASAAGAEPKPFAYLVRADDENVRYVITQSPWRIGRSRNNDLTLNDNSVSRQHAEIHRKADGSFTVTDLDSLNGVFVNDEKIAKAELNEGDSVDIGDVGLRFTLYDQDAAAQEPTVMLRTHTP